MVYFSAAPRFELLDDGTVYARAGTQRNCAGIAGLRVRISENATGVLTFGPDADHKASRPDPAGIVPGTALPDDLREAVIRGARDAMEGAELTIGVHFEIVEALVHEVDARVMRFHEAGWRAMKGWLDIHWRPRPDDDATQQYSSEENIFSHE